MTAYAYTRGHKIEWDEANEIWRYADTGDPAPMTDGFGGMDRPCAYCHQLPTPEGHDACLGELPGVRYACCGHGVEDKDFAGYISYEKWPLWMTNKNRWPVVIAFVGGLPLVAMTGWILYSLAFVSDFVVEDVFGWWMATYAVTAVSLAIAHWIQHMQTDTAVLLRRARHQAFVVNVMSRIDEDAHFLVGIGMEKKAE